MLKLKYAVTTNIDRMISRLTAHCLFSSMRLTKVVEKISITATMQVIT